MPGLEIHPFTDEHLDDAAALLAERHRRHREAEPLLTKPEDYRAEIEALRTIDGATGVVAARNGDLAGFLVGAPKDDGLWGPNVWVDPSGHAVRDPEDVRDLYAAAAAGWMEAERHRHYVVAPADAELLDAWSRVGFGRQQAFALREVPEADWPDGVRPATEDDLEVLVELGPLLDEQHLRAPVFSTVPPEPPEELREEIAKDLANPEIGTLVAEREGRVAGCFVLAPIGLSSTHSGLARVEGSILLAWAATRPELRGSGAGLALTEGCFAWARERGYGTMVTDWRETNLLSSRFWPRRGFRRTFLRLYRSIP